MLKGAGLLLIICSSTAIGYLLSFQLSERLHQLRQLLKMISLLEREISYGMATLPEALQHVGEKMTPPFSGFLNSAARKTRMREGRAFWEIVRECAQEELGQSALTKKDLQGLEEVGKYLGYLDVDMQKHTLSMYEKELEMTIKEAGENITTKKKLYQSLGIMCGLFLAIALY